MKYLFDGFRAATLIALILALWSFAGVSSAMDAESESAGMFYVLSAFGMLGLPQVLYGMVLAAIAVGWAGFFNDFSVFVSDRDNDRRFAAVLLAVPLLAVVIGIGVGGVHLLVTSAFVRASFQAMGLTGVAVLASVGAFAAIPLVAIVLDRLLSLTPIPSGPGRVTQTVLVLMTLTVLAAAVAAYVYASGLQVFSSTLLKMGLVAAFGMPALFFGMQKIEVDRVAYRSGVPAAGVIVIVATFAGAATWTSSSPEMRAATLKHSALVSMIAKGLQKTTDSDGDGYASHWGGNDCDDTNDQIYPGAKDKPGNGIDESCSGADAEPPKGKDHESRKVVARAFDAASAAAKRASENLPDPPKNLVVLLIDTLRIDHLGYAGYERDTSPHIDALARESSVFMNTYATSPHTPRSIPAIFISKYPSRTSWRGAQYNYPRVQPDNTSFAEILQEKGHQNFAFSSHHYFQEKRGLGQGFDVWDNSEFGTISESNDDMASPRIWKKTEPKIDELANSDKPFTLFVHLFDPHAKWIHHDEYPFERGNSPEERHKASYDSEIKYVDAYVGKIVDKLKATGLWDKSIVVLVSDHGEAFNEHGYFFHGQTLYNEVVRVPLLIRVPGWFHRKIETPVSILDVPPTVVDLMGYTPEADWDGQSLMPLMLGEAPAQNRPVFSELLPYTSWKEHHKAVVVDNMKFISILSAGTEELYDLEADPGETKNLASERPDEAERMRKLIEQFQNQ